MWAADLWSVRSYLVGRKKIKFYGGERETFNRRSCSVASIRCRLDYTWGVIKIISSFMSCRGSSFRGKFGFCYFGYRELLAELVGVYFFGMGKYCLRVSRVVSCLCSMFWLYICLAVNIIFCWSPSTCLGFTKER